MFKWLVNFFKEDPQDLHNRGYQYVVSEWNKSPNSETARRLWVEQDDPFGRNEFDCGMVNALHDLKIPDPYDPYSVED